MSNSKGKDKNDSIRNTWNNLSNKSGLSTKDKLDKLVRLNLKKKTNEPARQTPPPEINPTAAFVVKEAEYPLNDRYGDICLSDWHSITPSTLSTLFPEEAVHDIAIDRLLYFDTETTGLSGGTGTIPFMLGFGFMDETVFKTKIFILNDISAEEEMLEAVDQFIAEGKFSATVTYNGRGYDFPLMETRYILSRKRFPLLRIPHLDFLYPARTLWKHSFDSRKLGYLGEMLLGISREDDIDGSQIPGLYFSYLRTGNFSLIRKVVYHNELDLVGLSALLLKALKYVDDMNRTQDEGEILGTAMLYEKARILDIAEERYSFLVSSCQGDRIRELALKRLSAIKKRAKLYGEAVVLWEQLESENDRETHRELAIYYEHREKNYLKALAYAEKGLKKELSQLKKEDLEKRIRRLTEKIKKHEKE